MVSHITDFEFDSQVVCVRFLHFFTCSDKLLDDLKDRRGYSHLKEEALDRTMWGNHFGRGFGPVVRQTTE